MVITALMENCLIIFNTYIYMKVSVSEFVKDKVFQFLSLDSNREELERFESLVCQWMDNKVQHLPTQWHSEFSLNTSDGKKAIVSIVDVNKDLSVKQYEIDLN